MLSEASLNGSYLPNCFAVDLAGNAQAKEWKASDLLEFPAEAHGLGEDGDPDRDCGLLESGQSRRRLPILETTTTHCAWSIPDLWIKA